MGSFKLDTLDRQTIALSDRCPSLQASPVTCDVCSLTVSCQKTYESHIAGKPHRKRAAQTDKIKQLQVHIVNCVLRMLNSLYVVGEGEAGH